MFDMEARANVATADCACCEPKKRETICDTVKRTEGILDKAIAMARDIGCTMFGPKNADRGEEASENCLMDGVRGVEYRAKELVELLNMILENL